MCVQVRRRPRGLAWPALAVNVAALNVFLCIGPVMTATPQDVVFVARVSPGQVMAELWKFIGVITRRHSAVK